MGKKTFTLLIVAAFILLTVSGLFAADNQKVIATRNIGYVKGENPPVQKHKLDVYRPAGAKNLPVIIMIHGGGWKAGMKGAMAKLCVNMAKKNFVMVAPNYRLSPSVEHPAHVEDCAAAFAWVKKNIKNYGGDPERIFLMGHSAGGHLAALLTLDDKYLKKYGYSTQDVYGVIGISGVYNLTWGFGKGMKKAEERMKNLFEPAFGKDRSKWAAASPVTHAKEIVPPFLLVYGGDEGPYMAGQAKSLYKALKKAGAYPKMQAIKGRNHGSIIKDLGLSKNPATPVIIEFINFRSYD